MKENVFDLKKKKQEAATIMDADYSDDLVLLANTPAQAECIGLYINSNKIVYMCLKRKGVTIGGKPLKLVDQLSYLGCHISSIGSNVNIRIGKAWSYIDR